MPFNTFGTGVTETLSISDDFEFGQKNEDKNKSVRYWFRKKAEINAITKTLSTEIKKKSLLRNKIYCSAVEGQVGDNINNSREANFNNLVRIYDDHSYAYKRSASCSFNNCEKNDLAKNEISTRTPALTSDNFVSKSCLDAIEKQQQWLEINREHLYTKRSQKFGGPHRNIVRPSTTISKTNGRVSVKKATSYFQSSRNPLPDISEVDDIKLLKLSQKNVISNNLNNGSIFINNEDNRGKFLKNFDHVYSINHQDSCLFAEKLKIVERNKNKAISLDADLIDGYRKPHFSKYSHSNESVAVDKKGKCENICFHNNLNCVSNKNHKVSFSLKNIDSLSDLYNSCRHLPIENNFIGSNEKQLILSNILLDHSYTFLPADFRCHKNNVFYKCLRKNRSKYLFKRTKSVGRKKYFVKMSANSVKFKKSNKKRTFLCKNGVFRKNKNNLKFNKGYLISVHNNKVGKSNNCDQKQCVSKSKKYSVNFKNKGNTSNLGSVISPTLGSTDDKESAISEDGYNLFTNKLNDDFMKLPENLIVKMSSKEKSFYNTSFGNFVTVDLSKHNNRIKSEHNYHGESYNLFSENDANVGKNYEKLWKNYEKLCGENKNVEFKQKVFKNSDTVRKPVIKLNSCEVNCDSKVLELAKENDLVLECLDLDQNDKKIKIKDLTIFRPDTGCHPISRKTPRPETMKFCESKSHNFNVRESQGFKTVERHKRECIFKSPKQGNNSDVRENRENNIHCFENKSPRKMLTAEDCKSCSMYEKPSSNSCVMNSKSLTENDSHKRKYPFDLSDNLLKKINKICPYECFVKIPRIDNPKSGTKDLTSRMHSKLKFLHPMQSKMLCIDASVRVVKIKTKQCKPFDEIDSPLSLTDDKYGNCSKISKSVTFGDNSANFLKYNSPFESHGNRTSHITNKVNCKLPENKVPLVVVNDINKQVKFLSYFGLSPTWTAVAKKKIKKRLCTKNVKYTEISLKKVSSLRNIHR